MSLIQNNYPNRFKLLSFIYQAPNSPTFL